MTLTVEGFLEFINVRADFAPLFSLQGCLSPPCPETLSCITWENSEAQLDPRNLDHNRKGSQSNLHYPVTFLRPTRVEFAVCKRARCHLLLSESFAVLASVLFDRKAHRIVSSVRNVCAFVSLSVNLASFQQQIVQNQKQWNKTLQWLKMSTMIRNSSRVTFSSPDRSLALMVPQNGKLCDPCYLIFAESSCWILAVDSDGYVDGLENKELRLPTALMCPKTCWPRHEVIPKSLPLPTSKQIWRHFRYLPSNSTSSSAL